MTLVLHAAWLDAALCLWGETSAAEDIPRPHTGKRRSKAAGPPLSPYSVNGRSLLRTLQQIVGTTAEAGSHGATLWLPSHGGAPLPSSPLIADAVAAPARVRLQPWRVEVCPLRSTHAVDLLCACYGKKVLAAGVAVGDDLAYFAEVLRFAASLVIRQRFLPGTAARADSLLAVWAPLIGGTDADSATRLAGVMPGACRAMAAAKSDAPPSLSAAELLQQCLDVFVDHLVRDGLAPPAQAFFPRSHRRPVKGATANLDGLHDRWLYALKSRDAILPLAAAEAAALTDTLAAWRRPIDMTTASYRLSFRLEEPPDADALAADGDRQSWYLRYLLQAVDDPSLLVPAEDVWHARGRAKSLLQRRGADGREYLLAALGQSAGLSARIEASLKTAAPAGCRLDTAGAHEFITVTAPALEQAGFNILLPAWWTRPGERSRLALRVQARSPKTGNGGFSLDAMIRFDWRLALGGEVLSAAELEMLARLKAPLVRLRGQWVAVNAEEIRAAADVLRNKARGRTSGRELLRMAVGASSPAGGMSVAGVEADGKVGDLLKRLQEGAAYAELPPPAAFAGILRPYQQRGYSWLAWLGQWGLGACLADDMGLGKTVQTLAWLQRGFEAGERRPVLLVCPTSVVGNWQKEAARFTPQLPVLIHHGVARKKGTAFTKAARRHALVISSYALLHRDLEHLQQIRWAGVVLDEAQNIKNPEARQAQAARTLSGDFRVALTGTPVENNVGELWSIMEFLNPGFLGTRTEFKRTFYLPIQAGGDARAAARLKRIAGPFILRRLKTDRDIISDLPEKLEMKVYCTLTREQASLYGAVLKDMERELKEAEGIRRRGVILATLAKLKQVCNHPAQLLKDHSALPGRSGKLARLTEMLEEVIETGDHALVFTQFAEMGELLKWHLQETFGREIYFLHGGTAKAARDRMVERFQQDGAAPAVFILSLKAGGTGLNLTRANHVFHYDRWWNPAVENQATDRAFRIGQRKSVQVHKFLCAGTLEERIDEMIEHKKTIAEKVVGASETWLTELSNRDLKDILALRRDAVEDQ